MIRGRETRIFFEFFAQSFVLKRLQKNESLLYRLIGRTPTVGAPVTAYFDKETWLAVKTETVINSAMGSVSIVSSLSDYRKVDGMLV